jgi:small subunit ribosomal protein S17
MEENIAADKRGTRKQRKGIVVSDKQNKTISVEIVRRVQHPLFKKTVKKTKKFAAHDEKNEAKIGDTVLIEETRPLSKTKRWRLLEVLSRSPEKLKIEGDSNGSDANKP